jgi:hypothetical protein
MVDMAQRLGHDVGDRSRASSPAMAAFDRDIRSCAIAGLDRHGGHGLPRSTSPSVALVHRLPFLQHRT